MAMQKGMFPLEGTIGNLSFYKSRDGYQVRMKGGATASEIATGENFKRTRENAAEFATCARAGKLLRTAFQELANPMADVRMVSRLAGKMVLVLQADARNPRGMRKVIDGDAELLEGFEFNETGILSISFIAPYYAQIDRERGELNNSIPPFIPSQHVNPPPGATHFKLVSAAAEVNFENNSCLANVQTKGEFPLNDVPTEEFEFYHLMTPNSVHPLFLVLGITFFQQMNETLYPLKNGSFNALAIVKVSGR
jgi:hypothetical protein